MKNESPKITGLPKAKHATLLGAERNSEEAVQSVHAEEVTAHRAEHRLSQMERAALTEPGFVN